MKAKEEAEHFLSSIFLSLIFLSFSGAGEPLISLDRAACRDG
jgi:hypothetical protein